MLETTIVLKDQDEWRPGLTPDDLIAELDRALQFPGVTNSWTMPIKTRIDMLSTGIKTPVGIKLGGPDLQTLEQLAEQVEAVVKPLPGTLTAYAERVMGGRLPRLRHRPGGGPRASACGSRTSRTRSSRRSAA